MIRRYVAPLGLGIIAACSSPNTTPNPPSPPTTRTLFGALPVPTAGGTLRYSKAGDVLDGLTLTVPANAYAAATQWTVVADPTITVPLPADVAQVGPVLVVGNNQGYAAGPITLTTPMSIAAGNTVAPFYFDPATNKLEGIPLIDLTATSATLAARHFSADLIATRGPTMPAVRTANATAFSTVMVVWVKAADSTLKGTFTTGFKPGRDDWEFANYGDYVAPIGDCEGMSVTALYYQYFVKRPGQSTGLYHQYDSDLHNQWDNVQGIRFVGSVQGDYNDRFAAGVDQIATLTKQASYYRSTLKTLTASWLMLTLKLTGNPVLMSLRGPNVGHAVVAYAGSSTGGPNVDISFSDPNFPGVERSMRFVSGVLTPISLQLNATATGTNFDEAYALGVTGNVPFKDLDARYTEFNTHRAGADRYPSGYTWSYRNESGAYELLDNSVVHTTLSAFVPAIFCPTCPIQNTSASPPNRMPVGAYDASGTSLVSGGNVPLTRGDNPMTLVGYAYSPYVATHDVGFIDSRVITVIYTPPPTTIQLSVGLGSTTRPVLGTGETVQVGATLPLFATLKAADGIVVDEPVGWTSANASIASVDAVGGIVTGNAPGSTTITAQSSSVSALHASVTVNVVAPNTNPVASMVITPKTWSMQKGDTKQFTATLKDAAGNQTTLTNGWSVRFAVDDSNLGSIDGVTGLFSASNLNTGMTTVRAFLVGTGAPGNINDHAAVTVTNAP